jgi:hypothetical protein
MSLSTSTLPRRRGFKDVTLGYKSSVLSCNIEFDRMHTMMIRVAPSGYGGFLQTISGCNIDVSAARLAPLSTDAQDISVGTS